MPEIWILLKDIPENGKKFSFVDPALWEEPIAEFSLPYIVQRPLVAQVFFLVQREGVLIRGRIDGELGMPCDRCAEEASIRIEHDFDTFERISHDDAMPAEQEDSLVGADPQGTGAAIEISRLLWEEFLVSLPAKPLCTHTCKGLCPMCGHSLNSGSCACDTENYDPRLAALRGLTVPR